jgi:hypothetical protein
MFIILNPADLSDVTICLENAFVFEYVTLLLFELIAHFGPFGAGKRLFGGGRSIHTCTPRVREFEIWNNLWIVRLGIGYNCMRISCLEIQFQIDI